MNFKMDVKWEVEIAKVDELLGTTWIMQCSASAAVLTHVLNAIIECLFWERDIFFNVGARGGFEVFLGSMRGAGIGCVYSVGVAV